MRFPKLVVISLWVLAAAMVLGFVITRAVAGDEKPATASPAERPPLDTFFPVPAFDLVDQDNQPFRNADVDDKVWIGFIFLTNCPTGACPMMAGKIQTLQSAIELPGVEFVSFSVDPERDTPEVLKQYVPNVTGQEQTDNWHLLTGGTRDEMKAFAHEMLMVVGDDWGHTTRFLLVDRDGMVRGMYGNDDPQGMAKLAVDTRRLLEAGGR
jgi:protein SCO1/2